MFSGEICENKFLDPKNSGLIFFITFLIVEHWKSKQHVD